MKINVTGSSAVSDIPVSIPAPLNYTGGPFWDPFNFGIRSVQTTDLDGDGFTDIFISPSYAIFGAVNLHPYVFLNDGHGHFTDGTAKLFANGSPAIDSPNGVFINHFTSDGRLGMFIIDQGLELHKADGSPDVVNGWKAKNQFWLQDKNGVFQDMSSQIDINVPSFNHVSSIGDVNGDGNLDVIVTRLGGPTVEGGGTFFYLGDGAGHFKFSTAGLPDEVRYMPNTARVWNGSVDYQFSGTNTTGDVNQTGRADLITASYTGGDQVSGARTVNIYRHNADGHFDRAFQALQPDAVKALGPMGASGIVLGDLDGDGAPDLVVMWEGSAGSAIEVLKNTGNYQFKDVTTSSLGSYLVRSMGQRESNGEMMQPPSKMALRDVNHDGQLDIVLYQMASSGTQLAGGTPGGAFLYLNDGLGHFSAAELNADGSPLSAAQLDALIGTQDYAIGSPLQFDTTNSGHNDYVFISTGIKLDTSVAPAHVTSVHIATIFGADSGTVYTASDLGDTLTGSATGSKFYGGKGNDIIKGGAGNDVVYRLAGHDAIDGGAGIDTVVASGAASAYTITRTGAQVNLASKDGTISAALTGVERLEFDDAKVGLDIDGGGGQAYRLYQAAFNRVPDSQGLGFWTYMIDGGMTLNKAADYFMNSPEFQRTYGSSMSNEQFVETLYQNVLHRHSDAPGLEFWNKAFADGLSRPQALAFFSESPENHANLVGVMQNGWEYMPFHG